MHSLEYLHLQMRLEGKRLNQNGLMESFLPQGDDLPLVLVAQTFDEHTIAYFSERMSPELLERLSACANQINFPNVDTLLKILYSYDIQPEEGHYKTYVFPEHYAQIKINRVNCFSKDDPKVKAFGFDKLADQVYAIEDRGVILSACVAVRQNSESAESWVFTAPEHRRKGLGQLVVMAWAKGMLHAGIVPFYSHKIQNVASAKLANRLGLIPVFEEIAIHVKKA